MRLVIWRSFDIALRDSFYVEYVRERDTGWRDGHLIKRHVTDIFAFERGPRRFWRLDILVGFDFAPHEAYR